MKVTQPLRDEHADLLPHLEELDAIATGLDQWSADTPARLDDIVRFLTGHLIPHARAEEAALYPRVEQALGTAGAMDTMKADHTEIVRRIVELQEAIERIARGPHPPHAVEELRRYLYGLSAILVLHFHKEEDVLLPILDATLSEDDARTMFEEMVAVAHPSPASQG